MNHNTNEQSCKEKNTIPKKKKTIQISYVITSAFLLTSSDDLHNEVIIFVVFSVVISLVLSAFVARSFHSSMTQTF